MDNTLNHKCITSFYNKASNFGKKRRKQSCTSNFTKVSNIPVTYSSSVRCIVCRRMDSERFSIQIYLVYTSCNVNRIHDWRRVILISSFKYACNHRTLSFALRCILYIFCFLPSTLTAYIFALSRIRSSLFSSFIKPGTFFIHERYTVRVVRR